LKFCDIFIVCCYVATPGEATSLLKTIPQKQNLGPEIQQRKKNTSNKTSLFLNEAAVGIVVVGKLFCSSSERKISTARQTVFSINHSLALPLWGEV
jgi:hypothetical protein